MLTIDKYGWIKNSKIIKEQRTAIEHSPLNVVSAVVVHRTDSTTAKSILNAWKSKKDGAHFLISENGTIYQTASVNKQCWHAGQIYARCRQKSTCSEKDAKALEKILHRKNTSWKVKFDNVTAREKKKHYPDRYPHNFDSIGVEVVGAYSLSKKIYEIPNESQLESLFWLLDELLSTYNISMKDLYAHGKMAHKKPSEGVSSLDAYTIRSKNNMQEILL